MAKEKLDVNSSKGVMYGGSSQALGEGWVMVGEAESHHPYANNEDHRWLVEADPMTPSLVVRFSTPFDLEAGYDFVYLYDAAGEQVGPGLTGRVAPGDIVVNGAKVEFRLVTDRSVTRQGFKAQVFAQPSCICPMVWAPVCGVDGVTYGNACNARCDGVELIGLGTCEERWMALSGEWRSPSPYPNNYNRVWTIQEGADHIRVHFEFIDVELNYDFVTVLDGNDQVIARYTGQHRDLYSPLVNGDTIKIRLQSDRSVTATGFKVDRYEVMGGCYRDGDCAAGEACVQVQCFRAPCYKVCMPQQSECTLEGSSCASGQMCDFGGSEGGRGCGDGNATGTCVQMCDPSTVRLSPVPTCGCDGQYYTHPCFASAAGVSVQYLGECGAPHCGAIGSRSEGWYGPDGLIRWDSCAGAWTFCTEPSLGEEGWYRTDTNALVVYDRCMGREGEACSEARSCAKDLNCVDNVCVAAAPASDCVVGGCSGQLCAEEAMVSTCEWRPHYACYHGATCARQADGQCGWTMDDALRVCLDRFLGGAEGAACGGSIGVPCQAGLLCAGMPVGQIGGTGTCQQPCAQAGTGCVGDCNSGTCRETFVSTDTPLSIPDYSSAGVSSRIAIAGVSAPQNITVSVEISHTYRGDLRVELVAPNGDTMMLHDRDGGSLDNLSLIDVDVRQSLDPGASVDGTWTLRVSDLARYDTGRLVGWSLSFAP